MSQSTRQLPSAAVAPPARADGVALLGRSQGSGYKAPPALVRRGDGQMVQLTPLLYAVLDAVDGCRGYNEIAAAATAATGRQLAPDDVELLVTDKLRPLGLLTLPDGSQPPVRKSNPLLTLRPRMVISKPEVTRRITAPFAVLFTPVLVALVLAAFAVVAYWVLFDKGLAAAAHDAFARPGLLLLVFLVTVLSAGFHEFGHAAALRRGGGTPGAMGFGLYLVWPAFYTDVTDAYRLPRRARLRTDLGGLYFNAIAALVTFGAWWYSRWDALLLLIAAQILQMVRQLPPMVRFDGYHVLADLTGVPDLFHQIGPILRSLVPGRHEPKARQLKLWVRVVVTLWVLLVVPLMLLSALVAVVALPRLLATAAHSVSAQWSLFVDRAGDLDVLAAFARLLAVLAVLIPVAGIVYMLARLVRRLTRSVLRRTEGSPVKRTIAAILAAALVLALGYAWWPRGNYRPIQSYERGTLTQVLPASWTGHTTGLQEGRTVSAQTIWAGGALPTAAHPELALVLVPRDGNGQTWVFPFNRPAPPGAGDNQSLAVVTRNGSTVYDVAFALVWVTGDTALNKNEAYAFASCERCKAVAVSFQIVLIVGHAHVAAPQNIAAAVNYNCLQCLTQALAIQLVLTLPTMPTGDVAKQLQALWARIVLFSHHLQGLTYAQIRSRIQDYEQLIANVLRDYLPHASPSATGSGSASDAPVAPALGSAPAGGASGTTGPAAPGQSTAAGGAPPESAPPSSSAAPPESTPAGTAAPSP